MDDGILVEMSTEKLDDSIQEYSALSWHWGSPKESRTIRINNKNTDHPELMMRSLPVRLNLLDALKHLRQRDRIVRLWVDAISIEQIDEDDDSPQTKDKHKEKSNQIAMMTNIYRDAHQVHVWLGEEGDDSSRAMQFVDKLVNLEDEDHIAGLGNNLYHPSTAPSMAEDIRALLNLLKREWFSRRWVVQEIAMAKHAILHCGRDSVSWAKLATAISILEKVGRDGAVNRILKQVPAPNNASDYIGNISSLPAYRLVQNTTAMFRGKEEKGFRTWRRTLEELVSYLAAFEASRLHDTIYAILGLASDFRPVRAMQAGEIDDFDHQQRPSLRKTDTAKWGRARDIVSFEVDYEKHPLVVYKKFLRLAIQKSGSVDIMCRPWAPTTGIDATGNPQKIDLPSWILSISKKPFRPNQLKDMVRYNPDPLVGPAGGKMYSASGLKKVFCSFPGIERHDVNRMIVQGFILGEIESIWDSGEFGNVPGSWLQAGGWEDESRAPRDELWRTLTADRNRQGEDPDHWYPLVFQRAVKDRGISYGLETSRLIHESTNTMFSELFRHVQAVVWNRRLMRVWGKYINWLRGPPENAESRHLGTLGLAPTSARKGDLVCIIFGCSVPLVLREDLSKTHTQPVTPNPMTNGDKSTAPDLPNDKTTHSSDASGDEVEENVKVYNLIGESYVDHMMDGEAISYFTEYKLSPQKFVLE
jgi:hypothetical protein